MTASQMRIAETIDAFYGDAGTKDGVSRSYKQAVEDLDAETIKALDGPYRCEHFASANPLAPRSLTSPFQNHCPRTHIPLLRLLPRRQ
jgi:amphiphysin